MIILGIMAIIFGGIMYFNGNSINNDLDAQMESIFNDGVSNPGSTYETLGILLLVAGILLLLIRAIISSNKKNEEYHLSGDMSGNDNDTQIREQKSLTCKKCGALVDSESKFCMNCGESLIIEKQQDTSIVCPHCGGLLSQGSKFCMYCGKDVPNYL